MSILVGVSACHILSENKVEITCLVLKQNSEPESVSILWQDGFQEEMFAKIVCKCNANTFIQGIPTSQSFSLFVADPAVSSIQAQCSQGKFSGWIIIRGSLGFGNFPLNIGNTLDRPKFHQRLRIQVAVTSISSEISAKRIFAFNYSSSDLAAFVLHSYDGPQSVSLSADEFSHQSLLIGTIGKNLSKHFLSL